MNNLPAGLNEERQHLEGLLKDRLNFYLVYASLFLLGSYRLKDDPELHWLVLIIGTIVSLLMALAVLRTHLLVRHALIAIGKQEQHPYRWLKDKVKLFPFNANYLLVAVPFVLTFLFGYLALWQ